MALLNLRTSSLVSYVCMCLLKSRSGVPDCRVRSLFVFSRFCIAYLHMRDPDLLAEAPIFGSLHSEIQSHKTLHESVVVSEFPIAKRGGMTFHNELAPRMEWNGSTVELLQ